MLVGELSNDFLGGLIFVGVTPLVAVVGTFPFWCILSMLEKLYIHKCLIYTAYLVFM